MASLTGASLGGSCDAPNPISMDLEHSFPQRALHTLPTTFLRSLSDLASRPEAAKTDDLAFHSHNITLGSKKAKGRGQG